jgi:hypothetical protein
VSHITKLSYIFILALVSLSLHAAASCVAITNNIHADIAKYSTAELSNQHRPWMTLAWLQQQLGSVPVKTIVNDRTQYTWQCPNDPNSFLTVTTDQNGTLINVKGQYNSEEGQGLFAANLSLASATKVALTSAVSKFPAALDPKKDIMPPNSFGGSLTVRNFQNDVAAIEPQTMLLFKKWFNEDVTTEDQMQNVRMKTYVNYFSQLRKCVPGTYKVAKWSPFLGIRINNQLAPLPLVGSPQAMFFFQTSTILGMENGKCVVEDVITANDNVIGRNHCEFSPGELTFYTDEEADKEVKPIIVTGNEKHDSPRYQKSMQLLKECRKLPIALP